MKPKSVWHPFTPVKQAPEPLKVKSAKGLEIELEDGRKILDCISSWWVNLHGHCTPEIVAAIQEQSAKLEQVIFAGFTHEPAEELTRLLLTKLPDKSEHIFFSDNGSTAVEVALKLAIQFWSNQGKEKNKIIHFDGSYHGDTIGAMSVSSKSAFTKPFENHLFETLTLPYPYTFEGDSEVEQKEQDCFKQLDFFLDQYSDQIAAMILEPLVQGASGMRMCRESFLKKLHQKLKDHQILVIYDEVMTGFGRTGDWFSCSKIGTQPDIICISKGITGGFLPLAGTVCTKEIFNAFYQDDVSKSFYHGHSYTANPIGCAAGIASFQLFDTINPSFQNIEKHYQKYSSIIHQNNKLKNFRICGTISAMEVETGKQTDYFNELGPILRKEFIERGFLLRPLGNVIYLLPPYCIREEQIKNTYECINEVVSNL